MNTKHNFTLILKTILFNFALIVYSNQCYSQDTTLRYYNNKWLEKEVDFKKAKIIEKKYRNTDGSVTSDILNANDLSLNRSYTYKDKEPYGIWSIEYGKNIKKLNYNFDLVYANEKCEANNPFKASTYEEDIDSIKYIAPKLSTMHKRIADNLARNLIYPSYAVENEIQGTIEFCLKINELGEKEKLFITKSVDPVLDKESARVINELKIEAPAKYKDNPTTIYLKIPVTFTLE